MSFFKSKTFKIIAGIIIGLALILGYFYFRFQPAKNIIWGLNYSPAYASYLGFDPVKEFQDILTDLKPQKVRLTAYWEDLEPTEGQFDFKQTDQLLTMAEAHGTKITLVVGRKQPRWPECHQPDWFTKLSPAEQKQALNDMLTAVVNHFKTNPAIERWQVENEPFFNYGQDCPTLSKADLAVEVSLVKKLDNRPVVITDSGEKGWWFGAAQVSDVLGSTMYRKVYNPRWGGYITYPIPPLYYRLHAGLVESFTKVKEVIGVELQAEPWFSKDIHDTPVADQLKLMNPQFFKQYTNYARAVGFKENYLWGTEWWYWLKNSKGDSEMWDAAKQLLNP